MAPLIAPGICRYAVHGTYGGRPVVNIIDMRIDSSDGDLTRDEAVLNQARDILANWEDNFHPLLVNEYVNTQVSWVDLDEPDGSTGIVTSAPGHTWPAPANITTPGMPGNVAILVTKVAPGGGRRTRNGRMYLVGCPEANTTDGDPSNISPSTVTDFTNAAEAFSSDVSNTIIGEGYTSNMVVVHTVNEGTPQNPDIVFAGANDVDSLNAQSRLATIRRRLRP